MAGKLIVDTIDTDNSFITLNVQQSLIATMNVSGIYSNTGVKMIGANGTVSNTAITGLVTASQIANVANTQITGNITAAQITSVANTQITGNITSSQISPSITLTTPALGTPSALVLTNATGLPQAGLGTNVVGNGPAFGVYNSGGQALSSGVSTKLTFDTEEFDTNNNFASSRFTPTVAGYYQLNARARVSTSTTNQNIYIYKNGSLFKDGVASDVYAVAMQVNCLVYANGTTDYFEAYCLFNNSQNTTGGQQGTWFNGFLARAA